MDYRSLDPERDWEFFDPDCVVPVSCLSQIRPLTEESARRLWREFISPEAGHPMKLPGHAWPALLYPPRVSADWMRDWNDKNATGFEAWMRVSVPWPGDTPIIFTHAAPQSTETTWEVFCRYWRSFLFDNEGPFLWSLQQPQAIRFAPAGFASLGHRLNPSITT